VLSHERGGQGGLKEVIASIEGRGVYSRLKYESGVHRVQRVPATEASGRIHTSTATVAVLPEAEEVDIQIDDKDLRIDTFCSSGPGGQSVNTTYSAVRITHLPTGTRRLAAGREVADQEPAKAMKVLRSRLYEMEMRKQQDAIAKDRAARSAPGERSEKIRTYNFPQSRITDHRINFTTHQLTAVLDGPWPWSSLAPASRRRTSPTSPCGSRAQMQSGWAQRSASTRAPISHPVADRSTSSCRTHPMWLRRRTPTSPPKCATTSR
jgi:peptide chain release factor 1